MITIIAILVAILLPAVQRVRASSRATQSKNNLAQMGKAMKHYEGLGKGNLKQADWLNKLSPYLDNSTEVFLDPSDEDGMPSYALSNKVVKFGSADDEKIAIIEGDDATISIDCDGGNSTFTGDIATRHLGMTHALLYGGSVRAFELAEIDPADASHKPLVIWWLPYNEHGNVCGTVVVIDNPNSPPSEPSGTEPEITLDPSGSEPPEVPEDTSDCLVAHWTFDDGAGDTYADSVGTHDGTPTGSPQYVAVSGGGGYLVFNGVNDNVIVPYSAELNPEDYTLTGWYRKDGPGTEGFGGIVASREWDEPYEQNVGLYGYVLYATDVANAFQFWTGKGVAASPWDVYSGWNLSQGTWVYFAATTETLRVENGLRYIRKGLYKDGVEYGFVEEFVHDQNDRDPLRIGSGGFDYIVDPGRYWFNGAIDDVRLYNCVLTEAEVTAVKDEWHGP